MRTSFLYELAPACRVIDQPLDFILFNRSKQFADQGLLIRHRQRFGRVFRFP